MELWGYPRNRLRRLRHWRSNLLLAPTRDSLSLIYSTLGRPIIPIKPDLNPTGLHGMLISPSKSGILPSVVPQIKSPSEGARGNLVDISFVFCTQSFLLFRKITKDKISQSLQNIPAFSLIYSLMPNLEPWISGWVGYTKAMQASLASISWLISNPKSAILQSKIGRSMGRTIGILLVEETALVWM